MDIVVTTDLKEDADIYVLPENEGFHAYVSQDRYLTKLAE